MNIATVFLAEDGRLGATWRALLYVPAYILLVIAFVLPLRLWVGREVLAANLELRLLLGSLGAVPGALLAAYIFFRLLDRRSFRTLGLWFYDGWGRELAVGLAGGFVLLSVVVLLLLVAGQVHFRIGPLDAAGAVRGFGWTLAVLLPAAAHEELVFRGYPFQRLVEAWGAKVPIVLLSAVFGLLHRRNPEASWLSTANTVLMGILLALAYLKTRGLWLPIGVHFAWNFSMSFLYSLPVSGLVLSQKLLVAEVSGPAWLSGGNYGPEGSVLTTGVALAATLWLARTRRLGVSPALAPYLLSDSTGLAKALE